MTKRTFPPVVSISLPIATVWSGERRLEGETYLTEGFQIRQSIEASAEWQPLSEIADVWQPSRLKGIQVAPQDGVPFLTATQVFDIRPAARKWLAPSRTSDVANRYLSPGWILVTCSGNVGDTIVSHAPHENILVSHDLLRVQVKKAENLGYLYAFLRTKFGRGSGIGLYQADFHTHFLGGDCESDHLEYAIEWQPQARIRSAHTACLNHFMILLSCRNST